MLWIKAFHIIFVIAWFAGLLYLPRLFVYHAMSDDRQSRQRFALMERKLFTIMSIGGAGRARVRPLDAPPPHVGRLP